jgi:hypothetical protein
MAASFRLKKGDEGGRGLAGPKGQVERADSKEKEHEPQGGCGPKCKRAVETISILNKVFGFRIKGFKYF